MSEYVFDQTGVLPANLITDEQHVLTDLNYRDQFFIIPEKAPFFTNNLTVELITQVDRRVLTNGVDYSLVLPNMSATRSIGLALYGGIMFHNRFMDGIIYIDYQTIGGIWTSGRTNAINALAQNLYNPRTIYWDQVSGITDQFPPINHDQSLDSITGLENLLTSIDSIANSILNRTDTNVTHLLDFDNPHGVTKDQLGLDKVPNYPVADITQTLEGDRTDLLLSPLGLNSKFNQYSSDFLDRLLDETITIFRTYNDSTNNQLEENLRILFNDYAQTQREHFQTVLSNLNISINNHITSVDDKVEMLRSQDLDLRISALESTILNLNIVEWLAYAKR